MGSCTRKLGGLDERYHCFDGEENPTEYTNQFNIQNTAAPRGAVCAWKLLGSGTRGVGVGIGCINRSIPDAPKLTGSVLVDGTQLN